MENSKTTQHSFLSRTFGYLARKSLRLLQFPNFDFTSFNVAYSRLLMKQKKINNQVLTGEGYQGNLSFFTQYIPDRYSLNLEKYKAGNGFLSYADLQKWIAGNYDNNAPDLNRFLFFNLCMDYLLREKLEGNVAELGVYLGNSAFLLSKFATRINTTCFLFDTFESFDKRDLTGGDEGRAQDSFAATSLEKVKELVGESNTVYVKGYFPESLEGLTGAEDFILVHIDCDLEKPFIAALNYFYPRLKKGGFLIMHDHSSDYWPGATKAIDDFFRDKNEFIIPVPDKSGSCAIRKA